VPIPFGTTSQLQPPSDSDPKITPGPGAYNIIDNRSGEKIVISG
jgi:hypothetical protein